MKRQLRTVLKTMAALIFVLGVWGAFSWSLIPVSVNGKVEEVEYQSDTSYRLMVLRLDSGRNLVIDHQVVFSAGKRGLKGEVIESGFGSTDLKVGNRSIPLTPSRAFWETSIALGILCFLGIRPWKAAWVGEEKPPEGE